MNMPAVHSLALSEHCEATTVAPASATTRTRLTRSKFCIFAFFLFFLLFLSLSLWAGTPAVLRDADSGTIGTSHSRSWLDRCGEVGAAATTADEGVALSLVPAARATLWRAGDAQGSLGPVKGIGRAEGEGVP